jgi:DNA repair protein RadD
MRRPTKSLGLYIQQVGRALRTIGGNIETSIAAGKADCAVLDFAGNIDRHGPLDFIRPKETKSRLVTCEACGTRNASAARKCWSCEAPMTKLCPACLGEVVKGMLDCPHCGYDMRVEPGDGEAAAPKLRDTPSGAALIAAYSTNVERVGGWLPISKIWNDGHLDMPDGRVQMPEALAAATRGVAPRWLRRDDAGAIVAVLLPNGASRTSARQISVDGSELIVPLPSAASAASAASTAQ